MCVRVRVCIRAHVNQRHIRCVDLVQDKGLIYLQRYNLCLCSKHKRLCLKKKKIFFFDDTLLNQWHVAPALSPCSLYWPLWLSRCRLLTKVTAHAKWICLDFHQQPVTLLGAYFSTAFAEVLFILVTVSHHKDALKTGFQNQCFVFIQSWFFTSVLGDLIKK